MDDMVFQNNNKNAIYVLNTSYNTYGEFGRPNAFGYPQAATTNNNNNSSDDIYNNSKNCSLSRSLHKLKSLRHHSSEMIPGGGCGGASSAAESSNSSSMTSCSPAAAALQKLFNCSSSTAHSCKSINYRNNTLNNSNCHSSNSHISPDLSHHQHHHGGTTNDPQHQHYAQKETGKQSNHHHPQQLEYHHLMENQMSLSLRGNNNSTSGHGSGGGNGCGSGGSTSCVLPCVGGVGGGNKKKHFNSSNSVKSALIAKKTKFWKYLVEEEKWRKHSDENLSTTNNCERGGAGDRERFIGKLSPTSKANTNDNHTSDAAQNDGRITQAINNHSGKSNFGSCNGGGSGSNLNNSNWSGNSDTNKNNNNINQKSSAELYKEAAQLLGLSCTLCDNCRCLDCQSRYFECDDSDSYSEFSFMDEYFETLPTEVDRNFHHRSSPSFHQQQDHPQQHQQHSQDDEITSISEDQQPTSGDFENNVLDHCESLNDLTLEENCIENED
ncbi:uncharacterized protein DDB_G0292186 isoform X2 [Episyrphus balteatus]|uniref:uncharacterized protein DDB_G0292186 isoform X2 n=1 Tax=Episyrphus balteatus TaxID=286459 RepID=UPI002485B765|nr:uncharacterized protein DDB_G0292186 isoform X2 [Episyrphus balteatus]